ncbi:MAG: hypothetical protein ABIN58_12735, partial [candidate division WOR-3 bacterium]
MKILLLGYVVRGPWGGMVWHHLQYLLGVTQLGHEVYFLEDSDDYPSCYTPFSWEATVDFSYGASFLDAILSRFELQQNWAYYDAHSRAWYGPLSNDIHRHLQSASILLNLSGVNPLRSWFCEVPVRVLVDTDPVFTQVRHLKNQEALQNALKHNKFFTFGENFGKPGCLIPNDGLPWEPTRQPVVLDLWPVTPGNPQGKFTTVMQWRAYPPVEYRGVRFGMKSQSFVQYLDLPRRVSADIELAAKGLGKDEKLLRDHGWSIVDGGSLTVDPWRYQEYIRQSSAEFSVAKDGYVRSWSGWFSERSTAYMASGRPVLVQNTGFTDWLPSGLG